jgi:hypothetical protein
MNPPGSIRRGALHLPETDSALALLRSATRFGGQLNWFFFHVTITFFPFLYKVKVLS